MVAEAGSALPERIAEEVAERLVGADINSARALGAGIATKAYEISAASGPWVVRVSNEYPEPWKWRGGRRYEVPLLTELAACGLQVPRDPFAIAAEDGYPVAIVERKVAGRPLGLRHGAAAVPAGDHLAYQIAEFLTILHGFPVSRARALGVPAVEHGLESRELLGDAAPYLPDRLYRYLDQQLAHIEGLDLPQVLVHGDIRTEHLYFDADDSLVGVIDFGDASISDPAYDFAKLTGELGTEFGSSVLRCYGRSGEPSFESRIRLYERLELLWQVARPDASDDDRRASLRQLASLCGDEA